MSPKTPPSSKQRLPPSLRATPSNPRGSASQGVSDGYTSLKVKLVEPWIARDVDRQQLCGVKALIGMLLSDCLKGRSYGDEASNIALFDACREAVLSECGNKLKKSSPIIANLEKYCAASGEVGGYPFFIDAANAALKLLKLIKHTEFRDADNKLEILFRRSDPKILHGKHGAPYLTSMSKPDIVITSVASARRAAGPGQRWEEITQYAPEPPVETFEWFDILSSLELKRVKPKLDSPPDSFGDMQAPTAHQKNIREYFSSKKHDRSWEPEHTSPAKRLKKPYANTPRSNPRFLQDSLPESSKPPPETERKPADVVSTPVDDHEDAPPIVQCGMYGAEMLCGSIGVSKSVNLFIIDDVAWIWYYDRQGCIQSEGISFIRDLPGFLVLLYALQRLELDQWGLNPRLDGRVEKAHQGMFGRNKNNDKIVVPTEWQVAIGSTRVTIQHGNILHSTLGLTGRGTLSVVAKLDAGRGTEWVVVKIYWPEEVRTSEPDIVRGAKAAGKNDAGINHLPTVIDYEDLEYRTGSARQALGLEDSKQGLPRSRVLRVIVFAKLSPLSSLSGEKFIRAWLDCLRCHFKLWKLGFQHGDPSLSNLMVDPDTKRGVLNDWDLSYVDSGDGKGHIGGERTGTIPFMALDLLCDEYWEGQIERRYRHDLEGLIWVLPWVFLQFDGSVLKDPKLRAWQTGDYRVCYEEKLAFLSRIPGSGNAMTSWKAEWEFAAHLLFWLWDEDNDRKRNAFRARQCSTQSPEPREKSDDKVYHEFCAIFKNVLFATFHN